MKPSLQKTAASFSPWVTTASFSISAKYWIDPISQAIRNTRQTPIAWLTAKP